MKLLLFNGFSIDGKTELQIDEGRPLWRNGKDKPDGTVYTGYKEDGAQISLFAHSCGITYLDIIDEYLGPEDWALDQTS